MNLPKQEYILPPQQERPDTSYGNYNNPSAKNPIPPKKPPKWAWCLGILPVLSVALILSFFFIPSFKSLILRNVLSTTKYYEYIEVSCDEKIADLFQGMDLEKGSALAKHGLKGSSSLSFQPSSDLTETLGFDLSKLTCDIASSAKEERTTCSYAFNYDGHPVVNIDMYIDRSSGNVYFKIPELNEKYFDLMTLFTTYYSNQASSNLPSSLDSSSLFNLSSSKANGSIKNCTSLSEDTASALTKKLQQSLDAKTMTALVTDYVKFLMDDLGGKGAIHLSKHENYQIATATKKCDKFTISLTESQIKEVILDLLNKAKEDEKLQKIASDVTNLPSLYKLGIEAVISQIKGMPASYSKDPVLTMELYTDGRSILGRCFRIKLGSDSLQFSYGMIPARQKGVYTGAFVLSTGSENFALNFENYKITKDNHVQGIFTFTGADCKISAKFITEAKNDTLTLSCSIHGKNYGNCSIKYANESDSSISIAEVSSADVVPFSTTEDVAQYLENSKLESFLQNLMTTFDIPASMTSKQLADAIITSIRTGTSLDSVLSSNTDSSATIPEGTESDSPYKAEDYDLPSSASIDKDGNYTYELTGEEL